MKDVSTRPTGLHVVIAGGGVAALETMLALHALAARLVDVELLSAEPRFHYRPLAVAEPFAAGRAYQFDLPTMASACRTRFTLARVQSVEADERVLETSVGPFPYDVLVLALGARPVVALPEALTFRGPADDERLREVVDAVENGAAERLVFVVPPGATWPLPLYELALQTAAELGPSRRAAVELTLVTPEPEPLALFGRAASRRVERLLAERGIALHAGRYATRAEGGRLLLKPGGELPFDRLVALPSLHGLTPAGVPADRHGFVATDDYGEVVGLADVYAAGDMTAFPIKQGGVAAQQADAVAQSIAERAGAAVTPQPFRPVLRALLLTGGEPLYLRADASGGRGDTSEAAGEPLWWPPAKISARYLAPFLAELVREPSRK